jgi:hypothetical protein
MDDVSTSDKELENEIEVKNTSVSCRRSVWDAHLDPDA